MYLVKTEPIEMCVDAEKETRILKLNDEVVFESCGVLKVVEFQHGEGRRVKVEITRPRFQQIN